VFSGTTVQQTADALVLVTSREPDDRLYRELVGEDPLYDRSTVEMIGDCAQPGLIVHAVYSGHKAAREIDQGTERVALRRDRLVV
jgi:dimethylamine/trimethylamine dehydrogenase